MPHEHISFLKAALEYDPDNIEDLIRLGWLCDDDCHDYDTAIRYLTKATQLPRHNAEAYFWLAKVYFHNGYVPEARAALTQALSLDDAHVPSLSLLVSVHCDMHAPQDAEPIVQRALALRPSWLAIVLNACYVYAMLGQRVREEHYARRALAMAHSYARVSTPETYSYYEAAITGRWISREQLSRLRTQYRTVLRDA